MIVTNLEDPNFKRTIEVAIEVGKLVMVENVPEDVNIQIESLVRQEITKHNESLMIKFCRKIFKLDKGFGVILVSNLSTPHFNVNMTNYCTLVNFYITVEGLSQSLLNLVVANERKDLLENNTTSLNSTFDSVKALKDIENKLL
jgi:dynein heavy chain, axonemal